MQHQKCWQHKSSAENIHSTSIYVFHNNVFNLIEIQFKFQFQHIFKLKARSRAGDCLNLSIKERRSIVDGVTVAACSHLSQKSRRLNRLIRATRRERILRIKEDPPGGVKRWRLIHVAVKNGIKELRDMKDIITRFHGPSIMCCQHKSVFCFLREFLKCIR